MSFNSLFWASKDDILNAIAKLNFQFPLLGLMTGERYFAGVTISFQFPLLGLYIGFGLYCG